MSKHIRLLLFLFTGVQLVLCHLTVSPLPEQCKSTGCSAGGYGFYAVAKFAHSKTGMYTYKVSMKIPKLASATIKPEFIPGWMLSYNYDADPTTRWIHYTAYPGMEVHNNWVGMFQLSIAFKCGTPTAPMQFNDTLIVPMGTSSDGTKYYGALFPARQYLCVMVNGVCVPNGLVDDWSSFSNANYNETVCGNASRSSSGTCSSLCRGSTVPCISFSVPSSGCGNVSMAPDVAFGDMTVAGEGGDFPPAGTRELTGNPFAAAPSVSSANATNATAAALNSVTPGKSAAAGSAAPPSGAALAGVGCLLLSVVARSWH
jgi:hypothetical protein